MCQIYPQALIEHDKGKGYMFKLQRISIDYSWNKYVKLLGLQYLSSESNKVLNFSRKLLCFLLFFPTVRLNRFNIGNLSLDNSVHM